MLANETQIELPAELPITIQIPEEIITETPAEIQTETPTEYFSWEANTEWLVDRIIDQKDDKYLIRCKDFDESFYTWEPRYAIEGFHGLENWEYEHNNLEGHLPLPKRQCRHIRQCGNTKRRRLVKNAIVKVYN